MDDSKRQITSVCITSSHALCHTSDVWQMKAPPPWTRCISLRCPPGEFCFRNPPCACRRPAEPLYVHRMDHALQGYHTRIAHVHRIVSCITRITAHVYRTHNASHGTYASHAAHDTTSIISIASQASHASHTIRTSHPAWHMEHGLLFNEIRQNLRRCQRRLIFFLLRLGMNTCHTHHKDLKRV